MSKLIQYIRGIFKHGYDVGLIDRPIRFGPAFNWPSKKTIRLHRADQAAKQFTAAEVRTLVDGGGPTMKAIILLGVNCGFGNADVCTLLLTALDLDGGWVNYPRPKTGDKRRSPLWPETVRAIREALAKRPAPTKRDDARLVFITSGPASQPFEKYTPPTRRPPFLAPAEDQVRRPNHRPASVAPARDNEGELLRKVRSE